MANLLPSGSAVALPRTPSLKERQARLAVAKRPKGPRRRRGDDHPSLLPPPNDIQTFVSQNFEFCFTPCSYLHSVLAPPFLFFFVLFNRLIFLFTPVVLLRCLVGLFIPNTLYWISRVVPNIALFCLFTCSVVCVIQTAGLHILSKCEYRFFRSHTMARKSV